MRSFSQVNVFSTEPLLGNPVAVVHGADDLDDATMAAFARWTSLPETTFLLAPDAAEADYRLRIFTPGGELPFAGHPTLGSCRAWLEAGGTPRTEGRIVQECGVGLVDIRQDEQRLAFQAPPLSRSGAVDEAELARVMSALGLARNDVLQAEWIVNGPEWLGLVLRDAETVLRLTPDLAGLGTHLVGVLGAYPAGGPADVEVRAFVPGEGVPEDPVTGSLNAGFASWLVPSGVLPPSYVASQGTVLRRQGRVHVSTDERGRHWIGGAARVVVAGAVELGS